MDSTKWTLGTILQLILLITSTNGGSLTYSKQQGNQEASTTFNTIPSDFQCVRNGIFPVPGFCTYYYLCEDIPGLGLTSSLFTCPVGTTSDNNLSTCIPVSQVTTSSDCTDEDGTGTSRLETNHNDPLTDVATLPTLKRQKRIAVMTVLTGLIALGSLTGAATGVAGLFKSNKPKVDLKGIENKLNGIDGKLKNINLSVLLSQQENKMNFNLTQSLISKGMEENQHNFEITQRIINEGILESRINAAITQGLIIQGNVANEMNFAQVHVSIGELKQFVGQEISQFKSETRKGFDSVSTAIDKSRIEPLISELLILIKGFSEKLNHLNNLPEKNKKDEIERRGGYLEYLESSTLQDTLYDIIHQNFAIPTSATDASAVLILDLLVHGLQIHASMLTSIVSCNVYLAAKELENRNLVEFNTYMLRISSSTSRMRLNLGNDGTQGLIGEVKAILHRVRHLSFSPRILGLSELLSEKESDIDQLESDTKMFIIENTVLSDPGYILGKPAFTNSAAQIPIGPWEDRKQVSYAIQVVSDKGLSPIGEWSRPYTIFGKANPTIHLASAEEGVTRLVYRKFNGETPELVAIVTDNEQTSFRDIGRDIINAASRPNEHLAIEEVKALIDDGADVNVTLENKMTPLHYAAKYGNVEVMKLLSNATANTGAKSSDNEEALHMAALFGDEEAVAYLITEGSNINAQTRSLYWSPLHIAVANGHVNATKVLLQNNAFINIEDNEGLTPLHLSILGTGETLEVLSEEETLNVNAKTNDGLTPLHYAARSSSAYFAKILLQLSETDVNAQSDCLLSPLHYAAMSGNVEIATELMQHEASTSVTDKDGSTPLHYAAFYGNADIALALIEKDYSLKSIKNLEEKTALDLATENNRDNIIQILRNETEYLINKIREELEKSKNTPPETADDPPLHMVDDAPPESANCTGQIVQDIAALSEETCVHMGHITHYVHVLMTKIPLNVEYEQFKNMINSYNTILGDAKRNANVWRNRNSIQGKIQQTFRLAKDFEATFNRKYKIKQRRIALILQTAEGNEINAEDKAEIYRLEEALKSAQAVIQIASGNAKIYIEKNIRALTAELAEKRHAISVDPTTMRKLEEVISFLNFVKNDASKIKDIAKNTKMRTIVFKNKLNIDQSLFETNSQNARNSLKQLQRQSLSNNRQLLNIQQTQDQLETEISAQKRRISLLYEQVYQNHKQLREKRRELIEKMGKLSTLKYIGAFLTPINLVVAIPLQVFATAREKQLISTWQNNLNKNMAEVKRTEAMVKNKQKLILQQRETIANGTRNSDTLREELHTFNKLDNDLQNIIVDLPSLQPSLSHAIAGLEKVEKVFTTVTRNINDMIHTLRAAKSTADIENALHSTDGSLSQIQCYWEDIGLYVIDFKECSKTYNLYKQIILT